MRLSNKEMEIKWLQQRITILKSRGEMERRGIIAKLERRIRAMKEEN